MSKFIREIVIILIITLVSMLLLATVLYQYIPNRIQAKEISTYSQSSEVQNMLRDSVAEETQNVILTYEVTSTDLKNFENQEKYVPGKQNPFSTGTTTVGEEENTTSTNNTGSSGGTSNTGSSSSSINTTGNSSYFKETGTK